jgi:hypothetical protein
VENKRNAKGPEQPQAKEAEELYGQVGKDLSQGLLPLIFTINSVNEMLLYHFLRYLKVSLWVFARYIITFSMFLLIALEILSLPETMRLRCSVDYSLRAAGSNSKKGYNFC